MNSAWGWRVVAVCDLLLFGCFAFHGDGHEDTNTGPNATLLTPECPQYDPSESIGGQDGSVCLKTSTSYRSSKKVAAQLSLVNKLFRPTFFNSLRTNQEVGYVASSQ